MQLDGKDKNFSPIYASASGCMIRRSLSVGGDEERQCSVVLMSGLYIRVDHCGKEDMGDVLLLHNEI